MEKSYNSEKLFYMRCPTMLSVAVGSQGHPMLGLEASHDEAKQNCPMNSLFT